MNLRDTTAIAKAKMKEFGIDKSGWTFEFDNAKVRFGCTHFATKTITLSRYLTRLNDRDQVTDTILHEIAHVLAGKGHGHDRLWLRTADIIGANPQRCYDGATVQKPKRPYIGECPGCHRKIERHQRRKIACGTCCNKYNHGRFDAQYLFVWSKA